MPRPRGLMEQTAYPAARIRSIEPGSLTKLLPQSSEMQRTTGYRAAEDGRRNHPGVRRPGSDSKANSSMMISGRAVDESTLDLTGPPVCRKLRSDARVEQS